MDVAVLMIVVPKSTVVEFVFVFGRFRCELGLVSGLLSGPLHIFMGKATTKSYYSRIEVWVLLMLFNAFKMEIWSFTILQRTVIALA